MVGAGPFAGVGAKRGWIGGIEASGGIPILQASLGYQSGESRVYGRGQTAAVLSIEARYVDEWQLVVSPRVEVGMHGCVDVN